LFTEVVEWARLFANPLAFSVVAAESLTMLIIAEVLKPDVYADEVRLMFSSAVALAVEEHVIGRRLRLFGRLHHAGVGLGGVLAAVLAKMKAALMFVESAFDFVLPRKQTSTLL